MNKVILGTKQKDYYIQTNNGIDPWGNCGGTAVISGISTCGHDVDKIPGDKKKQTEDRFALIALNRDNWQDYANYLTLKRPRIKANWLKEFETRPPYRFPEILEYIINQIYGAGTAHFGYTGVSFVDMVSELDKGNVCIICGDFTPYLHFEPVVGYESDNNVRKIYVNDPAPSLYNSGNGYNQWYNYLTSTGNVLCANSDLKDNHNNITLHTYKIIIKKA